ncbi:MAG: DNA ligase, partial [Nocardioides sp.]
MPVPRPMLATKTDAVPVGAEWSHEVKWDGVRILAEVTDGQVRLWSRNANDVTVAWPDVALAHDALVPGSSRPRDLLVDGEIIALNDRGLPDFRVLQDRMHVRRASTATRLAAGLPATYMVFDLLRVGGEDLTDLPLSERRARLTALDLAPWQVPEPYDDGQMLLEATRAQGLEGVVSKRLSSRYTFDAR